MSEEEVRRIFQKKLTALIQERHVTQREIAAITGASTSTVSGWVNGLNIPRMGKIERLAQHFELPKSYFIEEDQKPAPSVSDEAIKFALFGGAGEITEAMYEEVRNFAAYVQQREMEKKKKE